jgi:thiol-disulfide isomerase/thioredoxin
MSQQPGPGSQLADAPKAAPFKAESLAGRKIDFPGDYRGKLVLLDFWATWCPPCRVQQPYLVKASEKYGGKEFVILGVTLDAFQRVAAPTVERFVREQKMTWDQVYQDAQAIAGQYGVAAIPAAFLVDGDTGAILASGDELHGDALLPTVERQLKDKRR